MIEIQGAYNTARCYTDALDEKAAEQIRAVCDREEFAGCRIRIMPDVHAGKGCTIGTTMTLHGRVVPGMVGVDIGCGMETVRLSASFLEPEKLDAVIRQEVPAGFDIRAVPHPLAGEIDLSRLHCASRVNLNRAVRSIGTLGGGNHFIEAGKGDGGGIYLIVHTGSRHLGCEVANHYQRAAEDALRGCSKEQLRALREELKAEGRQQEIPKAVQERKSAEIPLPRELSYVEGSLYEEYLHDMKLVQQYAALNRRANVQAILSGMGLEAEEQFSTIHNYIDTESGILRKGAVSARAGERLLIPMNMGESGVELLRSSRRRAADEPVGGVRHPQYGGIPGIHGRDLQHLRPAGNA